MCPHFYPLPKQMAVQSKTVWIVYVLRPMPLVALYLRGITENMGGLNASTGVLMPTILPTTTVCGHSMRVPHLNLVCCQNWEISFKFCKGGECVDYQTVQMRGRPLPPNIQDGCQTAY